MNLQVHPDEMVTAHALVLPHPRPLQQLQQSHRLPSKALAGGQTTNAAYSLYIYIYI